MLSWLSGRTKKELTEQGDIRTPAAAGFMAAESAVSLLNTPERRRFVKMLRENCPLSQKALEAWWITPLEALVSRVQNIPGHNSGAFAAPGGFIDLTLSVATTAVRLSRGMMLPPGVTPEEQAEQGPAWVCAVYWAALFHHLQWLDGIDGELQDGRPWRPGFSVPSCAWRIRLRAPGATSVMRGMLLAGHLLPAPAFSWLERWPGVSAGLLSFLSGELASAGILNGIITNARAGCGMQNAQIQAPVAPISASQTLPPAQAEIIPLSQNTVPPILSAPQANSLSSQADLPNVSDTINPKNTDYADSHSQAPAEVMQLASAFDAKGPGDSGEDMAAEPGGDEGGSPADLLSVLDSMAGGVVAGCITEQAPETAPVEPVESQVTLPASSATPEACLRIPGLQFREWLVNAAGDGSLSVNEHDSLLHVLAGFVFLQSPECFFRFIADGQGELGELDKSVLQKSFEALNIHHSRNGRGLYHYHKYDSPDKSGRYTKMSGYMIPSGIIFTNGKSFSDSTWLAPRK